MHLVSQNRDLPRHECSLYRLVGNLMWSTLMHLRQDLAEYWCKMVEFSLMLRDNWSAKGTTWHMTWSWVQWYLSWSCESINCMVKDLRSIVLTRALNTFVLRRIWTWRRGVGLKSWRTSATRSSFILGKQTSLQMAWVGSQGALYPAWLLIKVNFLWQLRALTSWCDMSLMLS